MSKFILATLGIVLSAHVAEATIVGWRTDGRYPNARPPAQWSGSEHAIWKTAEIAWSNASPVIVEDRVFVLGEPTTLLCLDRGSGSIRWQASNDYAQVLDTDGIKEFIAELEKAKPAQQQKLAELEQNIDTFEETDERSKRKLARMTRQVKQLKEQIKGRDPFKVPHAHEDNGYTSATPISDGEHVWAVFGTGTVVCYDVDGQRRWTRFLQKPRHKFGHSASPRMIDGKLIVAGNELFALDALTGETVWRTASEPHWGTPAVTHIGDTAVVITTSGQIVAADNGAVLAKGLPAMRWNGPHVVGRKVYFIEDTSSAYELPADVREPFEPKELWTTRVAGSRHYASPVVDDSLVFTISREGTLSVLDAETGDLVYKKKLGLDSGGANSVYTSVSVAGGEVFVGSLEGEFVVFKPGRTFQEVSRHRLERLRSTPVFIKDRVYVRGLQHVYCLGPAMARTASQESN